MKITKKQFKVEIRYKCKVCHQYIITRRFRTYCSAKCRNRFHNQKHKAEHAEYQRKRSDAKAVKAPGKFQCQICGKWYVQVGSHIYLRHKITAREYRKIFGFDVKKGQLAGWLKELKADHVFANGTVKNLKNGKKYWFKINDPRAGRYQRSAQTMERLKNLSKLKHVH